MSSASAGRAVLIALVASAMAVAAVLALPKDVTAQSSGDYIDYSEHRGAHFDQGKKNGVAVSGGSLRLSNPSKNNGIYSGSLRSPVVGTSTKYDTMIPSWQANTPAGTWMDVQVRVRQNGNWSSWFKMGKWASGTGDVQRATTNGQSWQRWSVYTDTIQSRGTYFANAYQYRIILRSKSADASPRLRAFNTVASNSYRHGDDPGIPALKRAWGKDLNVPRRSQYDYDGAGEAWCSPTSQSMIMSYFGRGQSVPAVARGVYDRAYPGWGNWAFNTAYASSRGLDSSVSRFSSITQAERWVDQGIPVVASIAWNNNNAGTRLDGAPLRASNGHLLIIRGFTNNGDVIVNDPAGSPTREVRRVYDREQFTRAWMGGSGGVVYLTHPAGKQTPWPYASHGSW